MDYYAFTYENPDYESLVKAKEIIENIPNKNLKITTDFSEKRIKELEIEINKNIAEGRYIFAIDRLHTFMHNYFRTISESHQIEFKDKDRLDELYKGYVNFLKYNGYIESKLSKSIFRSNLSILNEFNEVRNHKSYAHDNEVLNDLESQLIVSNIINIIYFISHIEEKIN